MTMLALQDEMNTRVHPQWRAQGNAWYRAIWVECAEMLDHYGWKWWKAQSPDMAQVELELIDIWHFGLSIELETGDNYETIAERLNTAFDLAPSYQQTLPEAIEAFTHNTLSSKQFDLHGFVHLLQLISLPFSELFSRYVAKNVLNLFRQDHGYKEGHYQKLWQGKEDNVHLMEILADLPSQELSKERIYEQLEQRYQSLV